MSGSLRYAAIAIGVSALAGVRTVTQSGPGRTKSCGWARETRVRRMCR
jgi:hypothetical protein